MGILGGALTVRRFRVAGDLQEGWRELYRARLNEFAFKTPPTDQGKEEVEGWVSIHNLLDTDFDDFNRWLYGGYALFALRTDKKRLPAKLLSATVSKRCEAWCAERGVQRCPAQVKVDIREALEREWLTRTLPSVGLVEAAWNIDEGVVLLHSMSDTVTDRFRKRFHRTFGLAPMPDGPLDWLDSSVADKLVSAAPGSFLGGGEG
jgi:hypothetical protein